MSDEALKRYRPTVVVKSLTALQSYTATEMEETEHGKYYEASQVDTLIREMGERHAVTEREACSRAEDLQRANSNNTALYDSLERTIAERNAALAEVEKLKGDAERYKLLRKAAAWLMPELRDWLSDSWQSAYTQGEHDLMGKQLDAKCDAALAAQRGS